MFQFLVFVSICLHCSIVQGQSSLSCRAPRSGVCINIWECPFYANLLKQKPRPKYLTMKMKENFCGLINDEIPKVCCRSQVTHIKNEHKNVDLLPEDCGPISNGMRIINGATASPKEFPWMALVAYNTGDDSDGMEFKCGGSLINKNYVLTAAHCLEDKSVLGIRLGEFDIMEEKECYSKYQCEPPVQDILIDKVIIHENYNSNNFVNDIALVRLATPANMTNENVKPICLPLGQLKNTNLLGKFLTVTGWGTTQTGHKSMVLNKVAIPIVPLKDCRKIYGKYVPISKNQICAGGYKGRDSCSGDSGGPLQYITNVGQEQRYVQDGIVSYGSKQCGIDGRPAIYTNVKEYMTWILDNLEP